MERARHRKSKSASGIEGIQQIQKAVSRLSTESGSYIDGSKREDMSSRRGATGTPMKKLLAEEMSKEVEPKRRSPGVIAKLMGLEGLPSPRHVHGQQKRHPDSYQHKKASNNIKSRGHHYDSRTNRSSSTDQPEFKDVYEDLEASHVVSRRCSSRWSASSILTTPEMALVQQKFIDANRLPTDEELRDTLFVDHLCDQQVDPRSTYGNHSANVKPSSSEVYESKAKAWRSERDTSSKHYVTSHLKRKDGLLLEPHNRHRSHVSRNSSRTQLEPTRIVVLKPNLGKMPSASTSSSIPSPDLSHGYQPSFKKIKEYPSVETVSRRRKDLSRDVGLSKPISKEAREIAREITVRMRNGCDETMDARYVGIRGYVGDESSYEANESDSESESEVFRLSCKKLFDDNNIHNASVNREARKRLSERWKTTRKYQDLEVVSMGNTLGEMLAIPDKEKRPNHLNTKASLGREGDYQLGSNNGTAILDGPLGISSRDGWMDEIITRNSSRSKSLLPPTGRRGRGHRRSSYHDELGEHKNLLQSETVDCGRSKFVKKNASHKEDYSSKYSKSRGKKPHPCQDIFIDEIYSSSEAKFEIQMETNIKDLSEQQSTFEMSAKADTCKGPVVDVMMISEPGSTTLSSECSELIQKQSSSVIDGDKSAAQEQEDKDCSVQELHKVPSKQRAHPLPCLGAELELSESSKEADHPSPISVLQVPFAEDASSSESFERVSAELQELRLQLQLLKMESGPDAEEEMQPSPVVSEGNYVLGPGGWEISYTLDVLIASGLEDADYNTFRTSSYSPDYSLDPNLFDNLEKKYGDQTTGTRLERRLLFDRINSALSQIFVEHFDSCPWVMPKLRGLNLKWQKQGVRDAVEKLLDQELSGVEISDKVVDREMQWPSNFKGEIETVGNEIEKLLVDDMIAEVLFSCVCS